MEKNFIKVYPDKVYTTLGRACKYANVLPNYVQPVFQEYDGLTFNRVGFAVGPAMREGKYLTYRKVAK
jgi:hypothetical protein